MTKIRSIMLVSVVCAHIIVTPIEAQEQYNNIRHLIREYMDKYSTYLSMEDVNKALKDWSNYYYVIK